MDELVEGVVFAVGSAEPIWTASSCPGVLDADAVAVDGDVGASSALGVLRCLRSALAGGVGVLRRPAGGVRSPRRRPVGGVGLGGAWRRSPGLQLLDDPGGTVSRGLDRCAAAYGAEGDHQGAQDGAAKDDAPREWRAVSAIGRSCFLRSRSGFLDWMQRRWRSDSPDRPPCRPTGVRRRRRGASGRRGTPCYHRRRSFLAASPPTRRRRCRWLSVLPVRLRLPNPCLSAPHCRAPPGGLAAALLVAGAGRGGGRRHRHAEFRQRRHRRRGQGGRPRSPAAISSSTPRSRARSTSSRRARSRKSSSIRRCCRRCACRASSPSKATA